MYHLESKSAIGLSIPKIWFILSLSDCMKIFLADLELFHSP